MSVACFLVLPCLSPHIFIYVKRFLFAWLDFHDDRLSTVGCSRRYQWSHQCGFNVDEDNDSNLDRVLE